MRLWSVHPRHLDPQGLVALWREGLLARKVLHGQTRGYRHHPQLKRFQAHAAPLEAIDAYLVRTSSSGAEKSLGPRSSQTEAIYSSFRARKEVAEQRLSGLKAALLRHKRLNRALRPLLAGKNVTYVRRSLRVGARRVYTAQVGWNSRGEANRFCQRARTVGVNCIVLKN